MRENGEFRDKVTIVSSSGKRNWLYPKQPHGHYTRLRTLLSLLLLVLLICTPFVKVNGHPVMLLNFAERKFILFGVIFGPHDFYLLGLALIATIVFIVLFTVVFGRLFCGWVCPQTVFMEMVFRRIDYWIEGDHLRQRKVNGSPWDRYKIVRKLSTYSVYFGLSFLIANILFAYVIGSDRLLQIVTDPPAEHLTGLTAMLAFTTVFYWIFAWLREQTCILICPYGRLQGVLLDRNSIVIAYDHLRGEPRSRIRRGQPRTGGDCVDCNQCVDVCPTGIDIRNGTQLECVNCTACIDACNTIMERIKRPKGLIRYDSANGVATGTRKFWTPCVTGYSVLLVLLIALLVFLLARRTDIDVTVLRTPGMFYQEQPDGRVSNVYDVKVLNKTFDPVPITLKLGEIQGEVRIMGNDLVPEPQGVAEAKLLVILARDQIKAMNTPLSIEVYRGGVVVEIIQTSFLGPVLKH